MPTIITVFFIWLAVFFIVLFLLKKKMTEPAEWATTKLYVSFDKFLFSAHGVYHSSVSNKYRKNNSFQQIQNLSEQKQRSKILSEQKSTKRRANE